MILSLPFSRQNRGYQSWTASNTHHNQHHHHHQHHNLQHHHRPDANKSAMNTKTSANQHLRSYSSTLNHTSSNVERKKPQLANGNAPTTPSVVRNQSALGFTSSINGHHRANDWPSSKSNLLVSPKREEIYAPASIASPRELASYRRFKELCESPSLADQSQATESQHYAAVSYRGPSSYAPSESGWSSKSGRSSAIGRLFSRVGGSLRRRKSATLQSRISAHHQNGLSSMAPSRPPSRVDSDIYATCKRREPDAEQIYAEGIRVLDENSQRRLVEHELHNDIMREGEVRTLIAPESQVQPEYRELVALLVGWINDELAEQRIIVRDLLDDLYDGQILCNLVEKLHNIKLDLVEVTQNEVLQRRKLSKLLNQINRILALQARWARICWSAEGIHAKNPVEIVHLLVTLALYYRAPIKMPHNVVVRVVVVQKRAGKLVERSHDVQLTGQNVASSPITTAASQQQPIKDMFDGLFELAPEKIELVKQSLANFVNRHLAKVNLSCLGNTHLVNDHSATSTHLDPEQFSDGLLLVFLIASLEDFFVPLGHLFTSSELPNRISQNQTKMWRLDEVCESNLTSNSLIDDLEPVYLQTALEPTSHIHSQPIHKLHNVNFALCLMEEAGLEDIRRQVRAEDIVNGDLKSIMRLLYILFGRYKHL